MTTNSSNNGSSNSNSKHVRPMDSHSLVVVVVDCSPLAWGERDFSRTSLDKKRAAAGKESIGPCVLEELLEAVQAFAAAVCTMERDAGWILMGVADNETAVLYPRKDQMQAWLANPESYVADTGKLRQDLITGVADLMSRAAAQCANRSNAANRQAAMAAAFSMALCCINRFLVAARTGVSALVQNSNADNNNADSGGTILALMGNNSSSSSQDKSQKAANRQPRTWSPRIFLIQASEDRSRDYNAFMNCAFAAVKHNIVVDGCFLAPGGATSAEASSSAFLEQACDLTGGVFMPLSQKAQIGGALTQVFWTVFLPPLSCRPSLNLPAHNKVDFRARCFETGEIVNLAFVCNQCLSIFKDKPKQQCPTCQAQIVTDAKRRKSIEN